MARETYVFTVAPDYTACFYDNGRDSIGMDEWRGRFDEFKQGMDRKPGFVYRMDRYELSGGRVVVDHVWSKG